MAISNSYVKLPEGTFSEVISEFQVDDSNPALPSSASVFSWFAG